MLSIYKNLYNPTAVVEEKGELFGVLDELFNEFSFDKKTDAFLICPSTFNGTRSLENHISSDCIGLDIDDGIMITDAIQKLQKLGLAAYIYTTPSSRNLDRFRIFVKFNRPVTSAEEYRDIWRVMNGILEDSVDAATQHAACMFYTPARYQGADNYTAILDGEDIDVQLYARIGRGLRATTKPKSNILQIPKQQSVPQRPLNTTGLKFYNPTFLNLQDCKFVKQKYLDEYFSLVCGTHHLGLYIFMTRVAGVAKVRGYRISDHQLAQLARQLDLAHRGRHKKRDVENEAMRAIAFVYGGNS